MSEPSAEDSASRSNFALAEIAASFSFNFAEVMSKRPLLAAASEAIHQGFHPLLTDLNMDRAVDGSLGMVHTMAFSSNSSWIDGMVNGTAGHVDTGRGAIRRAIEFCLNASRVAGNERRTEDWIKFHQDPKANRRFRYATKIPDEFDKEKYEAVQPLIVIYDLYSDMGVHANMGTLAGKWNLVGSTIEMNYQVDADTIDSEVTLYVDIGHQMLEVFADLLAPYVRDQGALVNLRKYARERNRELLMGFASLIFPRGIPPEVVRAIVAGDKSLLRQRFKELVKESKARQRMKEQPERRTVAVRKGCVRVVRR